MNEIICSVIGLGKLGAPLAAILAKHYTTIGVDMSQRYVDCINNSVSPVQEPGLNELLQISKANLSATTDTNHAIANSNISFIIVPTPSDEHGFFSNKFVLRAIAEIGASIAKKSTYHLVCITSTVMPGSTAGIIKDTLERASGRSVGKDLGLIYNPEFIALGNVIHGIENPDLLLIGESEPGSKEGNILENLYSQVCLGPKKIARTSYVNAELTKISINTFLTIKIGFANMIGQVCAAIPSADANDVLKFVGFDSRFSPKYLQPGLPFGGPCLPRDTVALGSFASTVGVDADIVSATRFMNKRHLLWLADQIEYCQIFTDSTIGILGLSYKAGTDVLDASAGIALAIELVKRGFEVVAYDPLVKDPGADFIANGAQQVQYMEDCIQQADILVVTTMCNEFRSIAKLAHSSTQFPSTIFDCWRMYKAEEFPATKLRHIGTFEPSTAQHVPTNKRRCLRM